MFLSTDAKSLRVYEALASEARLRIIDKLFLREMAIKELAAELYLSSAIVSTHVSKLQEAGLVTSRMKRVNGGTYKYCRMSAEYLQIKLSPPVDQTRKYVEVAVPVGHYTDCDAVPTCGIATTERIIGEYDNPTYFMDPERVHAGILWFARGYVEYKIPNYVYRDQKIEEMEISLEIGSEAPHISDHWPSDIQFTLNGQPLGIWTSPGDFGNTRGRLAPSWWQTDVNQYGLMKVLRITDSGTFIDGSRISDVCIGDFQGDHKQWTLRISAEDADRGRGGMTLYGRGFGNYDQDIVVRSYYIEEHKHDAES